MYKTSKETQERKDVKRQHILDTAAKVFSQNGYHYTSVKDIVEAASISIGSFYFYFKSKEQLFEELYTASTQKFQEIIENIVDVERFSLSENLTRAMITNLWMYEQHRELAKIMLIEAAGVNPTIQKMRMESVKEACSRMEQWFTHFKTNHGVSIPDVRVAALIYEGSFYYLINDWLESDQTVQLTDSGYAFCIYTLQALGVAFEEQEIRQSITEVLEELSGTA